MLVLTRREGEVIEIGEDIVVTVCQMRGHSVRIGIEAPESVLINRSERRQRFENQDGDAKRTSHADTKGPGA